MFSKTVPLSAFGGVSDKLTHVGLRSVPMGWINSVDIIQHFIRRFVFGTIGVNPSWEVQRGLPINPDAAAVVCMDGFDLISKPWLRQVSLLGFLCSSPRVTPCVPVSPPRTVFVTSSCSRFPVFKL